MRPPSACASLPEFREVELALHGVQSVWKLYGAGSIGSQALLGIPRVASLRDDPALAEVSAVWPFEPTDAARIAHVEIWPELVKTTPHPVRIRARSKGLSTSGHA